MTISGLAAQNCVPCEGTKPLSEGEAGAILRALPTWVLKDGKIQKDFRFDSYRAGLDFASAVGKIAEQQNHHPDILIKWRRVIVVLYTHSINGLSHNDFIMAAKSELEYERFRKS